MSKLHYNTLPITFNNSITIPHIIIYIINFIIIVIIIIIIITLSSNGNKASLQQLQEEALLQQQYEYEQRVLQQQQQQAYQLFNSDQQSAWNTGQSYDLDQVTWNFFRFIMCFTMMYE